MLPSLTKVYKKLIYQQLNIIFENKSSLLLCSFRSRYSTKHAWLNLINKRHSCLDKSGVVGTILTGVSKTLDCLFNELILTKLYVYGIDIKNLKLLQNFLSYRTQRVKLQLMVEGSLRRTTKIYHRSIILKYFPKWHFMVIWKNWNLPFYWRQHYIQLC